MKRWNLIKKFPKWAIVGVVFVGSTGLFAAWWLMRSPKPVVEPSGNVAAIPASEAKANWAATIPNRIDRLFLADGDLIDAGTGEVVAKDWLKGDMPEKIFYDKGTGKVIGQNDRGVARYSLDGKREDFLTAKSGLSVSKNYREALYGREGDMWRADLDWSGFKLVNERRVTQLGNLNETFLIQNIVLASENHLVLKNQNQLLRVSSGTGDVTQIRVPLTELKRGRSPEGDVLMGDASERGGRKVFAYRVETDEGDFQDVGRSGVNDYCWVRPDFCLILVGGTEVLSYNSKSRKFSPVCKLASRAQRFEGPSPDGKYVFAGSQVGIFIINTEEGKAEIFPQALPAFDWIGSDALLISNDVPSSVLRGTWFMRIGKEPQKVTADPYSVSREGVSALLLIPEADWVIFGTRDRLWRMSFAGEDLREISSLSKPALRLQKVQNWRNG